MDNETEIKPTKIWIQLEKLAMNYLNSVVYDQLMVREVLTEPSKDGGYDGELIIYLSSNGDLEHKILMEAKFRSNPSVPLNDFSKAVIISFNRAANSLYLFTNSHFSPQLIKELNLFKNKTNMNIVYVDNEKLSDFIARTPNLKGTFDEEFLRLFRTSTASQTSVEGLSSSCDSSTDVQQVYSPKPAMEVRSHLFCGKEYIEGSKNLRVLIFNENTKIFVIRGPSGSGKTTFIQETFNHVQSPFFLCSIDLNECHTIRVFFMKILESIYGKSLSCLLVTENIDVIVRELFGEINRRKTSEDDLMVLQHIFKVEMGDFIKHQDMYVFSLINILHDLINAQKENSLFIFYFLNMREATEDVLSFTKQIIAKTKYAGAKIIIESTDMEVGLLKSVLGQELVKEVTLNGFTERDIADCVSRYCGSETKRVQYVLAEKIKKRRMFLPFEVSTYLSIVKHKLANGQDVFQILDEFENSLSFGDRNWNNFTVFKEEYYVFIKECFTVATLLNGRITMSLFEQLYGSRVSTELLGESLLYTGFFEFKHGSFQIKNLYYYDGISSSITQHSLHKAASLLLDHHFETIEEDYQTRQLIKFRLLKLCGRFGEMFDEYQQVYDILTSENQYRTALNYLKDCEDAYFQSVFMTRNNRVISDIWLKELECYYSLYLFQHEEYAIIIKQLETLLNLNKELKHEYVQFLYYKWKAYFSGGDYRNAMIVAKECTQAENVLDVPLSKSLCGKSYVAWALTAKEVEGYTKARTLFEAGLEMYPESLWLSVEYHSHIACIDLLHNPINSVVHYKNILTLTKHTKFNFRDILHARIDICMALFYAKQYKEALLRGEEALGIAGSLSFINEEGRVLNIIGCLYMLDNQMKEAEIYFKEAAHLLKKCNAFIYKWRPLVNLMNVYSGCESTSELERVFCEFKGEYWNDFVKKLKENKYDDKLCISFRFIIRILKIKSPFLYKECRSQLKSQALIKHLNSVKDVTSLSGTLYHAGQNEEEFITVLG